MLQHVRKSADPSDDVSTDLVTRKKSSEQCRLHCPVCIFANQLRLPRFLTLLWIERWPPLPENGQNVKALCIWMDLKSSLKCELCNEVVSMNKNGQFIDELLFYLLG